MDVSNIISVTVSLSGPGISKIGFGEPGVLFYGDATVPSSNPITDLELVRRYNVSTALVDMVADGFATTDPVYYAVQAIASQTPAPNTVKVIRGGSGYTHAVELTPDLYTSGATIAVTVTKGATSRTYSQTAGGVSLAAEATAMAAAMNADASGWGTSGSGELTIAAVGNNVEIDDATPGNGEMWYYSARTNLSIDDVTADRGIATDLNAAAALDADWYGLVLADAFGGTEIAAASAWVASQDNKILISCTQDSDVLTGSGIGDTLKGLDRTATYLIHSKHSMSQCPSGAVAGRFLPLTPGTEMWALKTISGVTPSNYTAAEITAMTADFVNFYTGVEKGGVEIVAGNLYKGWNSGSSQGFIDTSRLIDALVFEVQSRVLAELRIADKVGYTNQGLSTIKKAILSAIRKFQPSGFATGSEFCNIPSLADISAADKAARDFNDVTFGATLAGGIAKVSVTGQLTV